MYLAVASYEALCNKLCYVMLCYVMVVYSDASIKSTGHKMYACV